MLNNARKIRLSGMKTPRAIWVSMKSGERARNRLTGVRITRLAGALGATAFIWAKDVFVSRLNAAIPSKPRDVLSIRRESAQGWVMSNQTPMHSVEIIFYSAASFLAVLGAAWFFFLR